MERPLSAQELRRGDTGRRKLSKNFSTEAVAYSAAHVESNTFKTIRVEVECRGYRIAVVEDLVAWGSQVLKLRIEPFLRFTNVELAGCNAMGVIVALEIDGVHVQSFDYGLLLVVRDQSLEDISDGFEHAAQPALTVLQYTLPIRHNFGVGGLHLHLGTKSEHE
ncbi:hypothetical protein KC347_g162 [Hortaea werneckii]|nr:hypothetical protein KC347_g162 [Hortaea werneckii]